VSYGALLAAVLLLIERLPPDPQSAFPTVLGGGTTRRARHWPIKEERRLAWRMPTKLVRNVAGAERGWTRPPASLLSERIAGYAYSNALDVVQRRHISRRPRHRPRDAFLGEGSQPRRAPVNPPMQLVLRRASPAFPATGTTTTTSAHEERQKSYGYALSLDEAKAAFRAEYLAWKGTRTDGDY
jgi:hypothetical protein